MKSLFRLVLVIAILFIGYWIYQNQQKSYLIDTTRTTVITKLQAVKNLETAKMTMTKIIEGKKDLEDLVPGIKFDDYVQNFLFKDELLFEAQGIITAGYDLSGLMTGAIVVNDDLSITITLPEAIILSKKLDEESKPFDRELGLFTKGEIDLETEIRNRTIAQFEKEAIEKGLLVEAQKNAKEVLSSLFATANIKVSEIKIVSPTH